MSNFDNDLKQLSRVERLNSGNKNTEYLRSYMAQRFNEKLIDVGGSIFDIFGIDFAIPKERTCTDIVNFADIGSSFQGKVRVTKWGMHFIYEACLFKPLDKDYSGFKIEPGRDARGVSSWYTCLTCCRNNIKFVKTNLVKDKANHYLSKFLKQSDIEYMDFDLIEWSKNTKKNTSTMYNEAVRVGLDLTAIKCQLPKLSKEQIIDYWNIASRSMNKDFVLATYDDNTFFDKELCNFVNENATMYPKSGEVYASKGVEIHFKIDEGKETWRPSLGKILIYLPYPCFPDVYKEQKSRKTIEYLKDEVWNLPETWVKDK